MVKSNLPARTSLELTGLVDIMLILVCYFLVSASLVKQPALDISLPHSSAAKKSNEDTAVIHIDQNGRLFYGSQQVSLNSLPAALKKNAALVNGKKLILKADGKITYNRLVEVMDVLYTNGISNFALATAE